MSQEGFHHQRLRLQGQFLRIDAHPANHAVAAVVLIDVKPFASLREEQDQMDYFMAASRARQLLAVVHSD